MFDRTIDGAQDVAAQIQSSLPALKSGSLRFWGQWFGRPHDNLHRITGCAAEQNLLRLFFNQGEVLSVWSPSKAKISNLRFQIGKAERLRWEWFYYGKARVPGNLYYQEFVKSPTGIVVTTNADWYRPEFKTNSWKVAVEIV